MAVFDAHEILDVFATIQDLAERACHATAEEQVRAYRQALELIDKLKSANSWGQEGGRDGYLVEKLGNMRWHFGAMCGLDETSGHPPMQHYSWLLSAIESARSVFEVGYGVRESPFSRKEEKKE